MLNRRIVFLSILTAICLMVIFCTDPTNPFLAPRDLSYSTNPATYTLGAAIPDNQSTIEGQAPFTYSSSPALPAGLTIDAATGVISGTPADTVTRRSCVITATNSSGNTLCTLVITVNPEKPKSLSYTINPAIYSAGRPILDNIPAITGGVPAVFTVTPPLPAGLLLDSLTGFISGTPTTATQERGYSVKAENVSGYITVSLIITVSAAPLSNQAPQWKHKNLFDTMATGQTLALCLPDSCNDPEGKVVSFNLLLGGPTGDSIAGGTTYRYTPPLADSGNFIVRIVGTDDSLMSDTMTLNLRVVQVDHDSTPPVISRLDPATDSITSSSSSRTVKVIAKDASGISGVTFALAGNTVVSGVKSDDSVWTGTITGLPANSFGAISVSAKDNSLNQNQAQMTLHIKYDPTATDNTPPDITPVAGITGDTIIRNSLVTATFTISDNSGLDSLYWTVNNQFAGVLVAVTGQTNQYRFTDTLTKFDTNRIVIVAVDHSTARNRGIKTYTVIYRTAPSTVTVVSPANGALNAPSTGLSFTWHKATCADGRTPSYMVRYGVTENSLLSGGEAMDTTYTPATATIKGNTQYFWQVLSIAGTDTVKSPTLGSFSFATVNTPPNATLQSPSSNATSIATTPTLMYGSTKGDGDAVTYTIWLGTVKNLSAANQLAANITAEQYPITAVLNHATKYYWRVIAAETQGYAHASDTTAVDSFYTLNRSPTWSVIALHDTSYYRVALDLTGFCTDPDGGTPAFSILSGTGATLNGNTLSLSCDSQAITIKAKDNFTAQPCSSTVTFRSYRFMTKGMRLLPAGTFQMGLPGVADTIHQVTLTHGFYIDTTEVTQGDYSALTGKNPSVSRTRADFAALPVESVNWFDAALYCNARSKRDGMDTVYRYAGVCSGCGQFSGRDTLLGLMIDTLANGYRLPTEAEWEYACRAGTATPFHWGADSTELSVKTCAWYKLNCDMDYWTIPHAAQNGPQPVADKLPNAFGLYDMSGNVDEWCNDYAPPFTNWNYAPANRANPSGPSTGVNRIIRGGHWRSNPEYLKSALRSCLTPDDVYLGTGFRVVWPRR